MKILVRHGNDGLIPCGCGCPGDHNRTRSAREVSTVEELDTLLDEIAGDPEIREAPALVELSDEAQQRVLQVGIGYPGFSMLLWYDWDGESPEALVSRGTLTPTGYTGYDMGGTWTEVDPDHAVPVDLARGAAREFLRTGARPDTVVWTVHRP